MKNSLFVGNKAVFSRHKNQWELSNMSSTKKKAEEKSRASETCVTSAGGPTFALWKSQKEKRARDRGNV